MGRLSGFKYREIVTLLKKFGFEFYRQAAGSHEIWHNPHTNRFTNVNKKFISMRVNFNQINCK